MDEKLILLFARIKQLEQELLAEIREKEQQFGYEVRAGKVRFTDAVSARHRQLAKSWSRYLRAARIFSIITAPVIWLCVVPVLFLQLVAEVYQFICFPVYGSPKVRRQDYLVMDRFRLR